MKMCHAMLLCVGAIVIAVSLGQRSRDRIDDMINTTNSRLREAIELPVKHPLDVGPPVFDEATGAYKFPPPPGFTAEEYDAELTRVVLEDMQREGNRLPGEPTLNERIKALDCSRLTPAQLADLAYFEKPESSASEASVRDGSSKEYSWDWSNVVSVLVWMNTAGWGAYAIWLWVQRWRGAGSK
jgi:hypothetical protein